MKKINLLIVAIFIAILSSSALGKIIIKVDPEKQQEMIYGMDMERLWSWNLEPEQGDIFAKYAVGDCKVSYVRVAMDALSEYEEGKFNWDVYEGKQFDCMRRLQKANPEIIFFLSPRPVHEAVRTIHPKDSIEALKAPYSCYPLWIGVFSPIDGKAKRTLEKFEWQKAADYMVRQVKFFRSKGFKVGYLDLKNENDKLYSPDDLAKMADSIRKQLGNETPKIIAPSSFGYGGCINWLNRAIEINRTDFFDIVGCHNTSSSGDPAEVGAIAKELNKPLWNTETHLLDGPDPIAARMTVHLFAHIRAGFGGFNDWLSLGNKKKEKKMLRNVDGKIEAMKNYYIFKHLVNTSNGGYYLKTNVPAAFSSTVAFIRGNELTIWVLNSLDQEAKDVEITWSGDADSDSVEVLMWDSKNAREGTQSTIKTTTKTSFVTDIKPDSLYCFTIKLKQ